jgi:CRP/FNR family cyclic AMP-dependent transcriptional regulator
MGSVAAIAPELVNWVPEKINNSFAVTNKVNNGLPFTGLQGAPLEEFEAIAREVSHLRGESLFLEGEDPLYVFIVSSGKVKLSVNSRDGRTAILRIAGAGEILGISAAMSGTPHETTAEALEPCRLLAIGVNDFLRFLQKYPEAAAEATACLLRNYRLVLNNVFRLTLPGSVAGRMASLLLEWLDSHNARIGDQHRLMVSVTQEEIASMANTSRETVSRVLHQFQQQRLISIKGASVTILQRRALEELAM